jgi:methylenetetrahydrofolate--tRNA-(uracil-5-)-methyltransferase
MNVNFGLFPPVEGKKKADRKRLYTSRAEAALGIWMADSPLPLARAELV